jgi:hypothetical protein
MNKSCYLLSFLLIALIAVSTRVAAQLPLPTTLPGRGNNPNQPQFDATGRPIRGANTAGKQDSLKRRDNTLDSITIYYRYFDSTRIHTLDSTLNDFSHRYPLPNHYYNLGNLGTAAKSFLFQPNMTPGWDHGFHAFDIYRLRINDTRFYQTTRPYTELYYLLGSKSEQMINILHTQNIKPNFNMAFQYRFINSPGIFQNQNTSHNNFRISGNYQSNNKRYTVYGIWINNKLKASENGGLVNDSSLNDDTYDQFVIPTKLGGPATRSRNFFNTAITTGNVYTESTFMLRQQYDLGQKDSLVVNDSTMIKLFYPRFRLQHTFTSSKQSFEFHDLAIYDVKKSDYQTFFKATIPSDTVVFRDEWRDLQNDFSIISFPEKNNLNQFLKTGIALQNLVGTFDTAQFNYHNVFLSGEYRNRTRNQKWDIEANGKFYLSGINSGDYAAQVSLKRLISKKLGYLQLEFANTNRTPSFVFNEESNFPVVTTANFGKENITHFAGSLINDTFHFALRGNYYIVSNYSYFDNYFHATQDATLFNVLHISAEKSFRLKRKVRWYSEVHVQQTVGNPPVNLPLIFTANRIVYEDNKFTNLFFAMGIEVRYHTPYKADNYSPFVGQFFNQNDTTIRNRPELNAFFNFRIKSFNAFVRGENILNLFKIGSGKLNRYVPNSYYPGFWFRVGILWRFVN